MTPLLSGRHHARGKGLVRGDLNRFVVVDVRRIHFRPDHVNWPQTTVAFGSGLSAFPGELS